MSDLARKRVQQDCETAHQQRLAALAAANHIRSTRATILQEIRGLPPREGVAVALDIMRHPTPELQELPLDRLVRAIRSFGTAKASTLLFNVTDGRVWLNPRLCDLTLEQRAIAAGILERHCTSNGRAA